MLAFRGRLVPYHRANEPLLVEPGFGGGESYWSISVRFYLYVAVLGHGRFRHPELLGTVVVQDSLRGFVNELHGDVEEAVRARSSTACRRFGLSQPFTHASDSIVTGVSSRSA